VGSGVAFRIVVRATGDESIQQFAPSVRWRVGETITLSPSRRYVVVDVRPGNVEVQATLLVDQLPARVQSGL
jgi:hypothetical protein